MKPKLSPSALYIGDNGRCFCGAHAGCSAKFTGRDISGQRVVRVTPAMCGAYRLSCESRDCGVSVGGQK